MPAATARRPMFARSADADTLIAMLEKAAVGQTITYEAMNRALGRPGKERPSALQTAINHSLKARVVFLTIQGEGIRRATDSEVVSEVRSRMPRRVQSVTRWAGRRLGAVNPDALDSDNLAGFNLGVTLGGMLRQAVTPATVKKLTLAVQDATKPLPLALALKKIE